MKRIANYLLTATALLGAAALLTFAAKNDFGLARNMETLVNMMRELSVYYVDEVDADRLMTDAAEGMVRRLDPYTVYMPEEDVEKVGVFEDQIGTYKADTLEELAGKLGISDTAAFVDSVKRYNECVKAGKDLDFGKEAKWLTAIDTPPYYGIHRHVRVSAVVSGVNVGPNMEVLAAETGEPIPGLFAIGNTAGNFYGGVDYSMYMPGLSLGRAHTQGYVIGDYVARL